MKSILATACALLAVVTAVPAQAQRTFTAVDTADFPEVQLFDIAFGQGSFWAVGSDQAGTAVVADSVDGEKWNVVVQDDMLGLARILYADGAFLLSGSSISPTTFAMRRSTDGKTWSNVHTLNNARMAYGGGVFVAVGNSGSAAFSEDGVTWTAATSESSWNFNGVTYGDGEFVSVGALDNQQRTTDGKAWTLLPDTAAVAGNYGSGLSKDVTFGNGQYYSAGSNTNVDFVDGLFWSYAGQVVAAEDANGPFLAQTAPGAMWQAVAHGNGLTVLVGHAGAEPRIAVSGTFDPSAEPGEQADAGAGNGSGGADAGSQDADAGVDAPKNGTDTDAGAPSEADGGSASQADGGAAPEGDGGCTIGTRSQAPVWAGLLLALLLLLQRRRAIRTT